MIIEYSPYQLDKLKVYNTQPNVIPFRTKEMTETKWFLDNKPYWTFYFKLYGRWVKMRINYGYISDLASIPWVAQVLLKKGKDGVHRSGTKPHDYFYELEKYLKDGELYAIVKHKTCAHECFVAVENKWIPFDTLVSKSDADRIMFDVIASTPRAHISRWKIRAMNAAFKTWIAHGKWRKENEFHLMNPIKCKN